MESYSQMHSEASLAIKKVLFPFGLLEQRKSELPVGTAFWVPKLFRQPFQM